jgi:tetratricopeptide (TPR) repeat protein
MSNPRPWRLAAYEIVRLPFDGWLLIPTGLAVSFIADRLARAHLLSRGVAFWLAGLLGAVGYVTIVKPAAERLLKPAHLGTWLASSIDRNTLRRFFDPSASVVPWLLGVGSFGLWLYSIERTAPVMAGILSIAAGALAVSLAHAVANLNAGRSTEIAVARSLLQVGGAFLIVLLLALTLRAGIVTCAFFVLTLSFWAARSYLRVSAGRVRQETAVNRDFGIKLGGDSLFLRCVETLIEMGAPPRLLWFILRTAQLLGLGKHDRPKEHAKARCAVLNLQHRYEELTTIARNYNAGLRSSDREYSEAVKNFEALALMWRGEFEAAERVIVDALADSSTNPYFLYTRARILWQRGGRSEALAVIDEALRLYEEQKGRKCLPGSAHRAFFLWEKALEEYFAGQAEAFRATIAEAYGTIEAVQMSEGFPDTADLIHNHGNLLLIREVTSGLRRVGVFRDAAGKFVSCLWRGSHLGSRYRMGLLHAIGTRNYAQAIAYFRWLRDSLRVHGYGEQLPFVRRTEVLLREVELAHRKGWVLSDRVLLCQSISGSAPGIEIARVEEPAEAEAAMTMRASVFRDLQLGPLPRELFPLLSPR